MNTLYRLTGWRIFAPSRMPWGESTDQWSEVDWGWFHKQPRVTFEPVAVDWVVGTLVAGMFAVAVIALGVVVREEPKPNTGSSLYATSTSTGFTVRSCVDLQKEPDVNRHCIDANTGRRF